MDFCESPILLVESRVCVIFGKWMQVNLHATKRNAVQKNLKNATSPLTNACRKREHEKYPLNLPVTKQQSSAGKCQKFTEESHLILPVSTASTISTRNYEQIFSDLFLFTRHFCFRQQVHESPIFKTHTPCHLTLPEQYFVA